MKFADKMKSYRQRYRWTQQDVADRLLVSRKTISSWENGRSYPDVFMLVQISDLYHVSLDDLLREDHEMIDSYEKEHKFNAKKDWAFTISYIINAVACVYILLLALGLLKFIPSLWSGWQVIIGCFLALATINVYYLISQINWKKISGVNKVGIHLTLIVIAILLINLDVVTAFSGGARGFGNGFGAGAVTAFKALALTYAIWLYPQFKERKN